MSQTAESRPLDARLARILVRPLIQTRITPNDLTTLRLILGLASAAGLAVGGPVWASAGAWLFALSNFVDHADGELARLSGRTSRWGHYYDLASDALIHVLLFAALGYGLRGGELGAWPTIPGVIAGAAVAFIFWLHMYMEKALGKQGARLPAVRAFEIEDIMYLFPLVTIFDIRLPFLMAAAIGAPVFACGLGLYFLHVKAARRSESRDMARTETGAGHLDANNAGVLPRQAFAHLDSVALKARYADHEFLFLPDFLSAETLAPLQTRIPALLDAAHRNYIPRHKKGGSVSRYELDALAPEIPALYRDPKLVAWLEALTGDRLMPCPPSDPHAYALYVYTETGDHIGWHYDTSYYRGKRYTLLLGLEDDSTSKLEYQLFRDDDTRRTVSGTASLTPGAMCFFNGDAVYHRITPLGPDQRRVAIAFEYVTDAHMDSLQRFVSDMKDAIAYFGFRQVFMRRRRGDNEAT